MILIPLVSKKYHEGRETTKTSLRTACVPVQLLSIHSGANNEVKHKIQIALNFGRHGFLLCLMRLETSFETILFELRWGILMFYDRCSRTIQRSLIKFQLNIKILGVPLKKNFRKWIHESIKHLCEKSNNNLHARMLWNELCVCVCDHKSEKQHNFNLQSIRSAAPINMNFLTKKERKKNFPHFSAWIKQT